MTVIFIRCAKSKGYLRIGIESDGEKFDFTVSEAEYREADSPLQNDNLTRDAFDLFYLADMRYRARLKALRILSFGDNSEQRLSQKLKDAGIRYEIISEVVGEMVSRGYINSRRQIEKLVLNEANLHNSGPLKIIPKLIAKGYKKDEITKVIKSLIESGDIDFDASKERLIRSKFPCGAESDEIKKLLYKNGYSVC